MNELNWYEGMEISEEDRFAKWVDEMEELLALEGELEGDSLLW